jgi:hypothetical protein
MNSLYMGILASGLSVFVLKRLVRLWINLRNRLPQRQNHNANNHQNHRDNLQ